MNIQKGNVGNLGDIMKHGMLIQLAPSLRSRAMDNSIYIEPHAFLLNSGVADGDARNHCAARLAKQYPAYSRYQSSALSLGVVESTNQESKAYGDVAKRGHR